MEMYEYLIRAAFEDAREDNYQHPLGFDPDMVADECVELVNAVSEIIAPFDIENVDQELQEERRAHVLQEAFVRTFEVGLAVGLQAGEEGIEVKIHIDRDTVAGLVQEALSRNQLLKG